VYLLLGIGCLDQLQAGLVPNINQKQAAVPPYMSPVVSQALLSAFVFFTLFNSHSSPCDSLVSLSGDAIRNSRKNSGFSQKSWV
jgi:hypothetical protein